MEKVQIRKLIFKERKKKKVDNSFEDTRMAGFQLLIRIT